MPHERGRGPMRYSVVTSVAMLLVATAAGATSNQVCGGKGNGGGTVRAPNENATVGASRVALTAPTSSNPNPAEPRGSCDGNFGFGDADLNSNSITAAPGGGCNR